MEADYKKRAIILLDKSYVSLDDFNSMVNLFKGQINDLTSRVKDLTGQVKDLTIQLNELKKTQASSGTSCTSTASPTPMYPPNINFGNANANANANENGDTECIECQKIASELADIKSEMAAFKKTTNASVSLVSTKINNAEYFKDITMFNKYYLLITKDYNQFGYVMFNQLVFDVEKSPNVMCFNHLLHDTDDLQYKMYHDRFIRNGNYDDIDLWYLMETMDTIIAVYSEMSDSMKNVAQECWDKIMSETIIKIHCVSQNTSQMITIKLPVLVNDNKLLLNSSKDMRMKILTKTAYDTIKFSDDMSDYIRKNSKREDFYDDLIIVLSNIKDKFEFVF